MRPLEHLFNNYKLCDIIWYKEKRNNEIVVSDKKISNFDYQLTTQTLDGENNKFTRSSIGYYQ